MSGWTCKEVRDPMTNEIIHVEWNHDTLGCIRSSSSGQGRQHWVWTDTTGWDSSPFDSLHEARVFATRHRELKYA